jgi:hypothetical protein
MHDASILAFFFHSSFIILEAEAGSLEFIFTMSICMDKL